MPTTHQPSPKPPPPEDEEEEEESGDDGDLDAYKLDSDVSFHERICDTSWKRVP